jgi:hypothetical protein
MMATPQARSPLPRPARRRDLVKRDPVSGDAASRAASLGISKFRNIDGRQGTTARARLPHIIGASPFAAVQFQRGLRDQQQETAMRAPGRPRKIKTIALADYFAPKGSRPARRQASSSTFKLVVIAVVLGLVLIAVNAGPVLSQGVQLLKVDVSVVAKGYRASKLIGTTVMNDKNEKVGSLDDIVIGQNRALFAVLQVGGFLGINTHLVALPYESLVIDDDGKKIELPGATRDELKKLAEFKYRS